jgi:hypothetical protein
MGISVIVAVLAPVPVAPQLILFNTYTRPSNESTIFQMQKQTLGLGILQQYWVLEREQDELKRIGPARKG